MKLPKHSDLLILVALAVAFVARRSHAKPGSGSKAPPKQDKIPDVLSIAQLRELASAVGMEDSETGAAIAMAESGGVVRKIGDNGDSIGLWQINVPSAPKQYKNRDMLLDAGFNAQAALAMSNGGTNWTPWTTFRNGKYKQWLIKGK